MLALLYLSVNRINVTKSKIPRRERSEKSKFQIGAGTGNWNNVWPGVHPLQAGTRNLVRSNAGRSSSPQIWTCSMRNSKSLWS